MFANRVCYIHLLGLVLCSYASAQFVVFLWTRVPFGGAYRFSIINWFNKIIKSRLEAMAKSRENEIANAREDALASLQTLRDLPEELQQAHRR